MFHNDTRHSPTKELGSANVFLSISAVLISIMAVTCNCLLIYVIVRSRLLKTPTNMFIASLAVGELLTGVFGIPFAAASVVSSDWPFSVALCQMSASLQVIGRSASTYSLVAICVDRWLAVSRPLKYSHLLTLRSSSISLAIIWLLAAVVGLLPLGPWGSYRYATDYYLCTLFKTAGQQQHLVKEAICSYLPASVICLTILLIIKEIKSHHRIFAIVQLPVASTSDPARDFLPGLIPGPRGFNRNTSRAMRSLFIVIGGYAAFCLPLSVLNILYQNRYPDLAPRAVVTTVVWMSFLCCVINPVIIILFNRKFRAQLKILVNQHLCPPVTASKEVFTVSTGLQHVLDATLVLNLIKHENASTTASIRRKVLRLGVPS
ncbi:hypothetical protein BsWGS_25057 [Bradybaena similaris]